MTIDSRARRYLANFLEVRTGQQISPARMWRVEIALKPLMRKYDLGTVDQLVGALASGPESTLSDDVADALLNNETSFFRDHGLFKQLETGGIERLRAIRPKRLRIWSVGCSTGQEAYSLAMIFADAPSRWDGWSIDLVATDVSGSAIVRAREGVFSRFEIQRGLPIRNMMRWFDEDRDQWRVKRELTDRISFQHQNLLEKLPTAGQFDIILCRNVMLYFAPDRRRAAFDQLAAAIAPDGWPDAGGLAKP